MFKKQSGLAPIAIILIIAGLLVIGGGAYWWKINKISAPAAPTNQTASWQTFTNRDGGYGFEYPSTWNAAVNKYNGKNSLFGPGANSQSAIGGVEVNEFNGTIDQFITYMQNNADIRYSSQQQTTINGLDAKKVQYSGTASNGSAYLIKKGNDIIFNVYIASQDSDVLKNFDLLAASFGLYVTADNSALPTSGWQTYRNDQYGFEIQYPSVAIKGVGSDYELHTQPSDNGSWEMQNGVGGSYILWNSSDRKTIAVITMPLGLYSGTDFHSAFLAIATNDNSQTNCVAQGVKNLGTEIINGISFTKATFGSVAAGHQQGGINYVTYSNNKCFLISTVINTEGLGAVEGIKHVDENTVYSDLHKILSTFQFINQGSISISIVSPAGGEVWHLGETHIIKWKATGVDNLDKVYIGYRVEGSGAEVDNWIAINVLANSESYNWKIPSGLAADALLMGQEYQQRTITIVMGQDEEQIRAGDGIYSKAFTISR